MARLIFKQRVTKPSANAGRNVARHLKYIATRDGAVRNSDYIAYIAKREGAVPNKNMDFGLFGKYSDKSGTIRSLKDAMNYVKHKTEEGTHIYKTIISVKEEDALMLGLDTRKGWEGTIKQQIPTIAKQMDIPLDRFEWLASVHMEKGHPHLHLDYWDKKQGVRDYFVTPQKSNDIREALTRAFFKDEMQPMFESRKQAKDLVKDETMGILGKMTANIVMQKNDNPPTHCDYKGKLLHLRDVQKHFPRYAEKLDEIIEAIPNAGSLKQKFMPEDVKAKLRSLAIDIVKSNPKCLTLMEDYITANIDIAQMYSNRDERLEEAKEKAEDYVYKEIENKILQLIKPMVLNREKELPSESTHKIERIADAKSKREINGDDIFKLCLNSLNILGKMEHDMMQSSIKKGEMSKQARKEFALKMQNTSGLDWESDR